MSLSSMRFRAGRLARAGGLACTPAPAHSGRCSRRSFDAGSLEDLEVCAARGRITTVVHVHDRTGPVSDLRERDVPHMQEGDSAREPPDVVDDGPPSTRSLRPTTSQFALKISIRGLSSGNSGPSRFTTRNSTVRRATCVMSMVTIGRGTSPWGVSSRANVTWRGGGAGRGGVAVTASTLVPASPPTSSPSVYATAARLTATTSATVALMTTVRRPELFLPPSSGGCEAGLPTEDSLRLLSGITSARSGGLPERRRLGSYPRFTRPFRTWPKPD